MRGGTAKLGSYTDVPRAWQHGGVCRMVGSLL